jgi:hypothetical protein
MIGTLLDRSQPNQPTAEWYDATHTGTISSVCSVEHALYALSPSSSLIFSLFLSFVFSFFLSFLSFLCFSPPLSHSLNMM